MRGAAVAGCFPFHWRPHGACRQRLRADIRAQGRAPEDGAAWLDDLKLAVTEELNRNPPFSLNDLAVKGHDIIEEFNIKPGPQVGKILAHLLEYVLDNPQHNKRELLLDEAARWLCKS